MVPHFKTLWISDLHLGTAGSRTGEMLNMLATATAERIYLVGDILDFESLRSRPLFTEAHWQVVNRLLEMADRGVEIIYVPGNHDNEVRQLAGCEIRGIRIALEAWHTMLDGRRFLVMHGDCLDGSIRRGTNLERFGAAAYGWLVRADARIGKLRRLLGHGHASIATSIKMRLKAANEYILRFEESAIRYARVRGADGVICGHIHRPALRRDGNTVYANDGDWVEHRSAIAETLQGELVLINFIDGAAHVVAADSPNTEEAQNGRSLVAA